MPMNTPDDEENYPPRPRWIGWAIVILMVAAALGVANVGWLIMKVNPQETAAAERVEQYPELAAGKKLVETSDCMRCHGWDRKYVGPSFADIAARYKDRADAAEYLAGKIRGGSVGVWGNVIMPRHPQISAENSLQMARWLMVVEPSSK